MDPAQVAIHVWKQRKRGKFRLVKLRQWNVGAALAAPTQLGSPNITRLRKESVARALKRDPQFATRFVSYLLSRIIRIDEDPVDEFFNFSERRLARVLSLFGQIVKQSKPECPLK
jgi:hypothetical protein